MGSYMYVIIQDPSRISNSGKLKPYRQRNFQNLTYFKILVLRIERNRIIRILIRDQFMHGTLRGLRLENQYIVTDQRTLNGTLWQNPCSFDKNLYDPPMEIELEPVSWHKPRYILLAEETKTLEWESRGDLCHLAPRRSALREKQLPVLEFVGSKGTCSRGRFSRLTFLLISRWIQGRAHVRLSDGRTVVAPSGLVAAAASAATTTWTVTTTTRRLDTKTRSRAATMTIDRDDVDTGRTTRVTTRNGEHSVQSRSTRERRASPQLGTKLTTASRGLSWGLLRLRFTGSIGGWGWPRRGQGYDVNPTHHCRLGATKGT